MLCVGICYGVFLPDGDNKIVGNIFNLGLEGEFRYERNGFALSFGYIGRNNIDSTLFSINNSTYNQILSVSGSTITFDYTREFIEFKHLFIEGVLSVGYANLDYMFQNSIIHSKNSIRLSPGLTLRLIPYNNDTGGLYSKFRIQYNLIDLALDTNLISDKINGNYISLIWTIGFGVH